MNNKTYYIVNHKYMNNTGFDEFENILSDLFNEIKSTMNVINDSDMTNILNSISFNDIQVLETVTEIFHS